jgi:hypothetical protein
MPILCERLAAVSKSYAGLPSHAEGVDPCSTSLICIGFALMCLYITYERLTHRL